MRIAGFDLGTVTLGIAVSDLSAKIAFSKETWRYTQDDLSSLAEKAIAYLKENRIDTVVLGLPKHMNGDVGISGERSLAFKDALITLEPGLKVVMWDERLTTTMALKTIANTKTTHKAQKRKAKVDALAAVNILQSYLDSINRGQ